MDLIYDKSLGRLGPQYRVNRDRYLQIKGQGWFLYTRGGREEHSGIESQGGIIGPFMTKLEAEEYLEQLIAEQQASRKL